MIRIAILGTLCFAAAAAAQNTGSAAPALGPGRAVWAKSFAEARAKAAAEHKAVYVEIVKDPCGACQRMEQLLYPAVSYEMMLLRTVPVRLDIASPELATLCRRYALPKTAPSTLIVSPGGALIFRLEGFDDAGAFYAHVNSSMKSYDALNVRLVHEPETKDDPKEELLIGRDLYRRFDPEEALPRLERAAASPKADAATRDEARAYLASAELDTGNVTAARKTAESIIGATRDPDRREQAELFMAQISLAASRPQEAAEQLRRFLEAHPKSARKSEAEALLAKIEENTGK